MVGRQRPTTCPHCGVIQSVRPGSENVQVAEAGFNAALIVRGHHDLPRSELRRKWLGAILRELVRTMSGPEAEDDEDRTMPGPEAEDDEDRTMPGPEAEDDEDRTMQSEE